MPDHAESMRVAITEAQKNPAFPFGSVLVDRSNGSIVARGANRAEENPLWHGEVDSINRCAAEHSQIDWKQLLLYTTAEPCPMCMSGILWAGIGGVVFGTSIPTLTRCGYHQIEIRAREVIAASQFAECTLEGGILEAECDALFASGPH
ncbi:nucleoside deaminase [Rubinisphaera margarita]|uniref:nucleoside deaminase n=1 Tax=Rubinisphaera margarita TaxID=2909586 RepID=UPI001EE8ECEA|nr:nucleoside deaminase [Rubinisphaera margarita]MCG6157301.1 nucleoside deaminase [Rubinisphaera margarita]